MSEKFILEDKQKSFSEKIKGINNERNKIRLAVTGIVLLATACLIMFNDSLNTNATNYKLRSEYTKQVIVKSKIDLLKIINTSGGINAILSYQDRNYQITEIGTVNNLYALYESDVNQISCEVYYQQDLALPFMKRRTSTYIECR